MSDNKDEELSVIFKPQSLNYIWSDYSLCNNTFSFSFMPESKRTLANSEIGL